MKGWVNLSPEAAVQPAEYQRLLGYPPGHVMEGKARDLADGAMAWYAQHGNPWVAARFVEAMEVSAGSMRLGGISFTSPRLTATLRDAGAHAAVLVAACAGPELEAEAHRLWTIERPDEYFFMETLGSAVVEHLVTMAGARLCAEADDMGMAVLPHYSPGYPKWDIAEQHRLLSLIEQTGPEPLPVDLEALPSGMLRPKKSLLAVFGVTRQVDRVRRITDLSPCENCSYRDCRYRRAPYRWDALTAGVCPPAASSPDKPDAKSSVLDHNASYSVSTKALRRWVKDRLTLSEQLDGAVKALFRYDGTTCSDLGHAIGFQYAVVLGPRDQGYVIQSQLCTPAPKDRGHTQMCQFKVQGVGLLAEIARETPLLGRPLNDVLQWSHTKHSAGCYCDVGSRNHKWGLVLETLHFAMVEREKNHQELQAEGTGKR